MVDSSSSSSVTSSNSSILGTSMVVVDLPPSVAPSLVDPPVEAPPPLRSEAERHYIAFNRSNKILLVMCCGLKDAAGNVLFDTNAPPWRDFKASHRVKATSIMHRQEIQRRWNLKNPVVAGVAPIASSPRAAGWNQARMIQWLEENPITEVSDVEYLRKLVLAKKNDCVQELDQERLDNAKLEKSWTGAIPFMRLIHCFIDNDAIKGAFMHRNGVDPTRMSMENRNSTNNRRQTLWELVAEKWNDPMFSPETEAVEDLHSDFVNSRILSYKEVELMHKATADRVQAKYSTMNTELTRIITMPSCSNPFSSLLYKSLASKAKQSAVAPPVIIEISNILPRLSDTT